MGKCFEIIHFLRACEILGFFSWANRLITLDLKKSVSLVSSVSTVSFYCANSESMNDQSPLPPFNEPIGWVESTTRTNLRKSGGTGATAPATRRKQSPIPNSGFRISGARRGKSSQTSTNVGKRLKGLVPRPMPTQLLVGGGLGRA